MKKFIRYISFKNERGVSLVLVAILIIPLIAIGALVIDLGMLYAARNQLQNAADAGALAGARVLYNADGTEVNVGANQTACEAARDNSALSGSGVIAVDVNWGDGNCSGNDNNGDIQRGHWSFATRTFTEVGDVLEPPDLWNVSDEELDDVNQIRWVNAVKVVARRQATPVSALFSTVLGRENFELSAEAVAYIGFAGSLGPGEVDQPIGICQQSILFNDLYQCNIGRMLNSSDNNATSNTGGWTNFTQPCDTSTPGDMDDLICESGNTNDIIFGDGIGSTNGVQDNVFRDLDSCWESSADSNGDGIPDTTWEITLPVIDCPSNAVSNCATLLGAVTVKVVWVQRDNPGYDQAPTAMSDPETNITWPTSEDLSILVSDLEPYFVGSNSGDRFPTNFDENATAGSVFYEVTGDNNTMRENRGKVRWASFVRHFNLRNVGPGDSAPYATLAQKSIYFLPSCEAHEPAGITGGDNYGILARVPVLVN